MPPASRRRRNPLGKQHKMGRRPFQTRVPDRIAQNEWFYENGGQRHGPVSPPQRKTLATKGTVTPATLVWKEGLPQWTPAKAIRGLFAEKAAEAPAATPVKPPPPPRFDQPSQSLLSLLCDLRHPLDIVVDRLRYVIPQDITANISRVAATAGVLCIYLAVGAFSAVLDYRREVLFAAELNSLGRLDNPQRSIAAALRPAVTVKVCQQSVIGPAVQVNSATECGL